MAKVSGSLSNGRRSDADISPLTALDCGNTSQPWQLATSHKNRTKFQLFGATAGFTNEIFSTTVVLSVVVDIYSESMQNAERIVYKIFFFVTYSHVQFFASVQNSPIRNSPN